MALEKNMYRWLLRKKARKGFLGSCLTLGVQVSYIDYESFSLLLRAFNFEVPDANLVPLSSHPHRASQGLIDETYLFKFLGFDYVLSLDCSDYEGADIIFDLNENIIPQQYRGAFDAVFDFGTSEHIFHVPNVLNNIHEFLKVDGYVVHALPFNNFPDHGFYCFNPTFFWDYYHENNYSIEAIETFALGETLEDDWEFQRYQPGIYDAYSESTGSLLGPERQGVLCCALKEKKSTSGRIPQQSVYKAGLWNGERESIRSLSS